MPKKKSAPKAGRLSMADMRALVNKKAGQEVAHDLKESNPTEVTQWIPTGCRWLDSIICRGRLAGLPVGKVVEIAGLEGTGKSYMAVQSAANAQKMGMDVIYFDSEAAVDPGFLEASGCDLDKLLYVQATSVEMVFETIEELLATNDNQMLFILDSLANTPCEADLETDFNPQRTMAMKPRILSKVFRKITTPLANKNCTLLILNQLKTNITSNVAEAMVNPYFTPGGKGPAYAYSLRIWLTGRKSKASFILDDRGFQIGSEVKAKIKKSRFGSLHRECTYKIIWAGGEAKIMDEDSWFTAIKHSDHLNQRGAWYSINFADGTEKKFQATNWSEMLKDEKFKQRVFEIMDEEVILKFERQEGDASNFFDIDGDKTLTEE
jgi:recombination protein RecA